MPDLSVRENLTLALLPHLARPASSTRRRQREIVDRFIRRLGIKCAGPEQPIRELSGGNQQKVLLARWLCMNPQPPDPRRADPRHRCRRQGRDPEPDPRAREQGLGVLMISSELEEMVEGADRVFVLRDGRTVAELAGERLNEHADHGRHGAWQTRAAGHG